MDAVFEHDLMQAHAVVIELFLALAPFSDHRNEIRVLREQVGQSGDVMPVPRVLPAAFDIANGLLVGCWSGRGEEFAGCSVKKQSVRARIATGL